MRYVLYHGGCYDGFGAAFAAWLKYGDDAKYIPVRYGQDFPVIDDATAIYILDFSYPAQVLRDFAKRAHVVVLDHHKTAETDLADLQGLINPEVSFDMHRSGALMAYEYFHSGPVPLLFQYLSDRDLWRFALPSSKRAHKAISSYPMDFEVWQASFTDERFPNVLEAGLHCERLHDQLVSNIIDGAWIAKVAGHDIPIVNTSIAWSEVGNDLLIAYPHAKFSACFTVRPDHIQWSLRSQGDFDVSEIARLFNGGGHKNAAGFRTARHQSEIEGIVQ